MSSIKIGSKELHDFMASKKILICDPSTSFSSVIQQTMLGLGARADQIVKEPDFYKARHFIESERPEIIISEYHLGKGFGLELAEIQAKQFSSLPDRIFILVTGNASDSAVAEAAEEEIDGYVLKPFNLKQLQDTFHGVMERKRNPSKYITQIQDGKKKLEEKEYKGARDTFKEAKSLDGKPSLACYYEGFSLKKLNTPSEALECYREGRAFNPLHYKCLHGEFDILFEQKKQQEAYEVIKIIKNNYPVSPGTLSKMFLLAIYTYNYKDIANYYDLFTSLDRRSDQLVKIVMEALYSAGRFCVKSKDLDSAIDFFKKGVAVAQRDKDYLKRVIHSLLMENNIKASEEFLMMFLPDDRETSEFLQLDFEIAKIGSTEIQILERGKKVISAGKANESIYRDIVKVLVRMNKQTFAEEIIFKSSKEFPDLKHELYKILEDGTKAQNKSA